MVGAEYTVPFLQFFVPGPQPLGVTDVGQVRACVHTCMRVSIYAVRCCPPRSCTFTFIAHVRACVRPCAPQHHLYAMYHPPYLNNK